MKSKYLLFTFLFFFTTLTFAQVLVKKTVYFDFNGSSLTNAAKQKLDSLAKQLQSMNDYTIQLSGHTDSVGSAGYNNSLAERRNNSVKEYLVSKKINAEQIKTESYGKNKPIVRNTSETSRALNRRVEIVITGKMSFAVVPPPIKTTVQEKKDSIVTITQENGIKISYDSRGSFDGDVTMITKISEMQANGFTTMTVSGQPLASIVMVCIKRKPGDTTCVLKYPVTILVPVFKNPSCGPNDVRFYDAKKDSSTGTIQWKELLPKVATVMVDGELYFTWTITNACTPCKNFDCPKTSKTVDIRLKSRKYKLKDVTAVYESANALLPGKQIAKNRWEINMFTDVDDAAIIKVQATKRHKHVSLDLKLSDLRFDAKQNCYFIDKKMMKAAK